MTDQQPDQRIARFAPKTMTPETSRFFVRPSILFLALGGALTLGIVSWLGLIRETEDIRLDIADITVKTDGNVELTGARYRGRLESGDAFEITADRATEMSDGTGKIALEEPVASVYFANGDTTSATSRLGTYDQQRNAVDLSGDVIVTDYAREMTLQTEALSADLVTGTMFSDTPVLVQNPTSNITANGMRSLNNGEQINFIGNAKMTLQNISSFE